VAKLCWLSLSLLCCEVCFIVWLLDYCGNAICSNKNGHNFEEGFNQHVDQRSLAFCMCSNFVVLAGI
jgi:hypothetical protein